MTDRELHKLAATAAGFASMKYFDDGPYVSSDLNGELWHAWNPLTDDGDALRLAVKMHLVVDTGGVAPNRKDTFVCGQHGFLAVESHGEDPFASTRRAIVSAAAEIGKAMQ